MVSLVRLLVNCELTLSVNLGKSVIGSDVDDKWTDVDIAVKEYDQIILDLVAVEITGTLPLSDVLTSRSFQKILLE
jgi:hypothetical protein